MIGTQSECHFGFLVSSARSALHSVPLDSAKQLEGMIERSEIDTTEAETYAVLLCYIIYTTMFSTVRVIQKKAI